MLSNLKILYRRWRNEVLKVGDEKQLLVQLGDFTVFDRATIRPLESDVRDNPDFQEVVPTLLKDIVQYAEVKTRPIESR